MGSARQDLFELRPGHFFLALGLSILGHLLVASAFPDLVARKTLSQQRVVLLRFQERSQEDAAPPTATSPDAAATSSAAKIEGLAGEPTVGRQTRRQPEAARKKLPRSLPADGGESRSQHRPAGLAAREAADSAVLRATVVRASYEQRLAAWLDRHKLYPSMARRRRMEGEALLRVVIERDGKLRFRALEEASGYLLLNQAALEMVERADPFPAVPDEITGPTFEFLVPVEFRLNFPRS